MHDRRKSSLWIMGADGSRNRFLVEGSGARWSPSGDRIAFVADGEPEGSQIFVRWMDAEGAITQVTRVDRTPGRPSWSPDGESIAFTMTVPGSGTRGRSRCQRLPRAPRGQSPHASSSGSTTDRTARGSPTICNRHLFVVPTSGGTARQLTDGNWDHAGAAWTPDGQSILFSSLRVDDADYAWRGERDLRCGRRPAGTSDS